MEDKLKIKKLESSITAMKKHVHDLYIKLHDEKEKLIAERKRHAAEMEDANSLIEKLQYQLN